MSWRPLNIDLEQIESVKSYWSYNGCGRKTSVSLVVGFGYSLDKIFGLKRQLSVHTEHVHCM